MGQFSWLDCETDEQILDNVSRDVYVLVPQEFGGGHIKETCYDGYGNFGGHDIFDLVADWNRKYFSKHPEFTFPSSIKRAEFVKKYQKEHPDYQEDIEFTIAEKSWYQDYANLKIPRERVVDSIRDHYSEWRTIGIALACYDEDNAALPYPIKITHNPKAVYENCEPSLSDPNQGWLMEDDDEDEDDDWWN